MNKIKSISKTKKYLFIFGVSLAFFSFVKTASAATDFISVIDTGSGSGYDYSSLSSWESAMTNTATDLTSANTKVFSGTVTSSMSDNVTVYQCRGGTYQSVSGTMIHDSSAGQALIKGITGGASFQVNDRWYTNNTCNSAAYFTISDTGDSAIAVAKCRATTGAADTTAVTIDGFTTSATNYVKIWTDPNEPYRHNGIWQTDKYRLAITPDSDSDVGIHIQGACNIHIEGIQFELNFSGSGGGAWFCDSITDNYVAADVRIEGCIFRQSGSTVAYDGHSYGIRANAGTYYSVNNIFYDYRGGALDLEDSGAIMGYGGTLYVYNNTFYNCRYGIRREASTVTATNCLADSCTDGFSGTMATSYCATDLAEGLAGMGDRNSQTFTFANEAGDNFHLVSTDVGARNFGTDLSSDPNFSFSTDIDGQARPIGGTWDIGADEEGPKTVFYSVGQDASTNNMTGTPTVTISGGTATFSEAQTGNIGVGDRITYNTSSIAYISGKVSTTQWNVVTATGQAPSDITGSTVVSIKREYTTLSAAEAGATDSNHLNTTNLVAGNYQLNFPCYYDTGADITAVEVNGWTTGANNYIKVYTPNNTITEVNTSQRHDGKWNTSKYRLEVSGAGGANHAISILANYAKIEGMQIDINSTGDDWGIYGPGITNAGSLTIAHNIIKRNSGTTGQLIGIRFYDTDWTSYIYNNIIYDFNNSVNGDIGINLRYSGTSYVYNNTFHNNAMAVMRHTTSGGTVYLKNNLFSDSYDSPPYGDTSGMIEANCDYNATSISTLGYTAQTHDRVSQTIQFADESSDDFHLSSSDTGAKNHGTNLYSDSNLSFSSDIDGDERGSVWDIGADEYHETNVSIGGEADSSDPPIAYYNFNEGFGDTAHNSVCTDEACLVSTNGTLNSGGSGGNATTTAMWDKNGKFGGAMEFDGTNDYVNMGDVLDISGNQISISVWVYPRTLDAYSRNIVSKENDSETVVNYQLYMSQSNQSFAFCFYTGGWNCVESGVSVQFNQWQHVVATYNGNQIKIYKDGNLGNSGNATANLTTNSENFRIGGPYTPNGLIDEVKIFDYALTADQVKREYNGGMAMQLGASGATSGTGAATNAASGEYCVPGDTTACAAPVGEWKFDEKTGTTAYDTSGRGNNGTISGASWGQGKFGSGLKFDISSDNIITLPSNQYTQPTTPFSVGAWVKADKLTLWNGIVGNTNYQWTNGFGLYFDTTGGGQLRFYIQDYANNVAYTNFTDTNNWHYIIGVWDGSNIRIYLDGVEGTSDAYSGSITYDDTTYIGAIDSQNYNWEGSIDQVRIYDYARTPAQIAWEYNKGKPIAHWRMNENVSGNGQTIHDESGNGNHGTTDDGANNTGMDCTVDGKFGYACDFDNADDYIQTASAIVLPDAGSAVSFWYKNEGSVEDYTNFFAAANDYAEFSFFRNNSNSSLRMYINQSARDFTVSRDIFDSEWHNVVIVWSVTGDWGRIYIDGDQDGSFSNTLYTPTISSLSIGYVAAIGPTGGKIDDFRIYNYAPTAEQVKQIMNEGTGIKF